jgi:hypothetical protein
MTRTVTIPISIRVDTEAVQYGLYDIDKAVRTRTDAAVTAALRQLPIAIDDAWFGSIPFTWSGPGVAEVDGEPQDEFAAYIRPTIRDVAKAHGIANRLKPPPLDVPSMGARLLSPNVETRSRAFLGISRLVENGDPTAFWLALLAIRADGSPPTEAVFQALSVLHKRDPATFRRLLEWVLASRTSKVRVHRTDRDITVDKEIVGVERELGGALRVAERYADVGIAQERKKLIPNFDRLESLLRTLRDLAGEVARRVDTDWRVSELPVQKVLDSRPDVYEAAAGVLFVLAGDPQAQQVAASLEPDLRATAEWLGWALSALDRLDAERRLYEEVFDVAADDQPEVQVLYETRELLLRHLADYPFPTAATVVSLRREEDAAVAGWRLAASDRRMRQFQDALDQLQEAIKELHPVSPIVYGGSLPDPATAAFVPFAARLAKTRLELDELEADFGVASEHLLGLTAVMDFEQRRASVVYRMMILGSWQATLELERAVHEHDIGSSDEKSQWVGELDRLRVEMRTAFDAPDLDPNSHQWGEWDGRLRSLQSDIEYRAQIEGLESFVLEVAVLLVTERLTRLLPKGLSPLKLGVLQAWTLVGVTTVARTAWSPEKTFDASATLNELVDTFAFIGTLGIVDKLATEGALRFLRGRPLAQFVAVVGVNTVAATGLPIVLAHLSNPDDPRWRDRDAALVVNAVVVNTLMLGLSAPEMLSWLESMKPTGLYENALSLRRDVLGHSAELAHALDDGSPSDTEFGRLQKRGVSCMRRAQRAIEQLAEVPEYLLGQVGETRSALRKEAAEVGKLADFLAGIKQVGHGNLLLPSEALPDVVVRLRGGVFEYDPSRPQSSTRVVKRRLERSAGYHVEDEAGILLLSAGPGQPTLYRLLPAPSPTPPRVVSAESAAARELVAGAVGAEGTQLQELLAGRVGEALLTAAQLEPELVREAIVAEGDAEKVALQRLEDALRDDGLAEGDRALNERWLERSLQGVAAAGSIRRSAAAAGPRDDLLAAAGGGARASEILSTSDGRALLDAAGYAPAETHVAVFLGESGRDLDELEDTWRARGLPPDRVPAARAALDALLHARTVGPLTVDEELVSATGANSPARSILNELKATSPLRYRILTEAYARQPALVRRAIRANELRTRTNALSELARRLQRTWIPNDEIVALGKTITALNAAHLEGPVRDIELGVRGEAVAAMRDVPALQRDAAVVVTRFKDARKARAQQWLAGGLAGEAADLARAVDGSPDLQKLAGQGGATTLRQLWAMYRAGRSRPSKLTFPEYVELLQRTHNKGLHGEYSFAFWAGPTFIVIKAPDAGVTVGGTDIVLIPRGGGPPIWVDQKAVEGIVPDVSALMRNLPQNVADDLAMMESLTTSGHEYPTELLSAIPIQREASRRIDAIVKPAGRRPLTKEQIESPAVQALIDAALKPLGIRRVVGTFGGQDTELGAAIKQWFELWTAAKDD